MYLKGVHTAGMCEVSVFQCGVSDMCLICECMY